MILCWAAFVAILGLMWPAGPWARGPVGWTPLKVFLPVGLGQKTFENTVGFSFDLYSGFVFGVVFGA